MVFTPDPLGRVVERPGTLARASRPNALEGTTRAPASPPGGDVGPSGRSAGQWSPPRQRAYRPTWESLGPAAPAVLGSAPGPQPPVGNRGPLVCPRPSGSLAPPDCLHAQRPPPAQRRRHAHGPSHAHRGPVLGGPFRGCAHFGAASCAGRGPPPRPAEEGEKGDHAVRSNAGPTPERPAEQPPRAEAAAESPQPPRSRPEPPKAPESRTAPPARPQPAARNAPREAGSAQLPSIIQ